MALTKKQRLFVQAVVSDPTKPIIDCVKEAGYSRRRLNETASDLKKHTEVQAAIADLLNKKLESEPTKQGVYKSINWVKEMCVRNPDCQWSGALLLKATEMEMKALGMFTEQPKPIDSQKPIAVNVVFVENKPLLDWQGEKVASRTIEGQGLALPAAQEPPESSGKGQGTTARTLAESEYDPLAPWNYCSWRGHGDYQGAECPKCRVAGKKELRVGLIPGGGWSN